MADGGLAFLDVTMPGRERPQARTATGLSCGTAVMTAKGVRSLAELAPGDRVMTRDRGFRPLRGVTAGRPFGSGRGMPSISRRVRIAADAFGPGLPSSDLLLAPDHRLLLSRTQAQALSTGAKAFAAAGDLVGLPGVSRTCAVDDGGLLTPVCDRPELIWAEGLWCETAAEVAQGVRPPRPVLLGGDLCARIGAQVGA
jgi:hypothetical protein